MKIPAPVTLTSPDVRLEPLTLAHAPALARVGLDPALWGWIPNPITDADAMQAYVTTAIDEQRRGVALPFAIVETAGGSVIGSTRFAAIDVPNRRLEIGWTWLARSHQRTRANTAAKRLLLGHAFDALGANRVAIKTDIRNERSQAAIERLGAVREGVVRHQYIRPDGTLRDTVLYSVVPEEWPAVRAHLRARLAAHAA